MGDEYFPKDAQDILNTNGDIFVNTVHSPSAGDIWFGVASPIELTTSWTIFNDPALDTSWNIFAEEIASILNFSIQFAVRFNHLIDQHLNSQFSLQEILESNFFTDRVIDDDNFMAKGTDLGTFDIRRSIQSSFSLKREITDTFHITRIVDGTL